MEKLEELRSKAVHRVTARIEGPLDGAAFATIPGIRDLTVDGSSFECRVSEAALDATVKLLARHRVLDVSITEADLEEMFLAYYGEESADAA